MIYHKSIVPKLNRFYSGHFQNTPNIKTFFGYAYKIYIQACNVVLQSINDILLTLFHQDAMTLYLTIKFQLKVFSSLPFPHKFKLSLAQSKFNRSDVIWFIPWLIVYPLHPWVTSTKRSMPVYLESYTKRHENPE